MEALAIRPSGHGRPAKTYPMTLHDLDHLANAVALLDGHVGDEVRPLVEACHEAIRRAAGADVHLLYQEDDDAPRR